MEKFASYLSAQNISQRKFAENAGIDQSVVSKLANGKAKPGLVLAIKIEGLTAGAVPVTSWSEHTTQKGAA